MARTSTLTLKSGRYVHYNDFNLHINPKAHKLWAARVSGFDPSTKYKWQMDFLDTEYIDGDQHYDMAGIDEGDLLRVKAASHGNDKTTVMRVDERTDDEMVCVHLSDEDAIDQLNTEDTGRRNALEREIRAVVAECSVDELERLRDYAELLQGSEDTDVEIRIGGED